MTQGNTGKFGIGRVALALAAVIALASVVWSLARDRAPEANAVVAQPPPPSGIAELERKAEASPEDSRSWAALGLAYFEGERFDDAVSAYGKASTLDPGRALLWSALGEARVMASKRDPMPADAVSAFERAIALDKADPRARYFLAVKRDLGGDHAGAIADWLALLADTPADAPWRGDLIRTIEQVGKINRIDVAERIAALERQAPPPPLAARAIPGPSAQDLAAARAIPPGEQRDMAEGMVSSLETKLKARPQNPDGWIMLMRSRMTLGEPDKASAALRDAVKANPAEAAMLRQQAEILGVK